MQPMVRLLLLSRKGETTQKTCRGDETLELYIKQYIEAQTTPEVLFIWHGGEPLLRTISFYERAVELQQRYAEG